jgi:hypothetical protein
METSEKCEDLALADSRKSLDDDMAKQRTHTCILACRGAASRLAERRGYNGRHGRSLWN